MGQATIYHNPNCSKSRAALAILQKAGAAITVIDYLQNPPSAPELARLTNRAGLTPHDILRPGAPRSPPTPSSPRLPPTPRSLNAR